MLQRTTFVGGLCLLAATWCLPAFSFNKGGAVGAVYTMTNAAGGNSVVVYDRLESVRRSGVWSS